MRKDVRIGLAIGGVLLAVLIVYLLVPKENTGNTNKTQIVAQGGGAPSTGGLGGGEASPAAGASGADSSQPPAPAAGPNHDAPAATTRQDDPSFAPGTKPAEGGAAASADSTAAQGEPTDANSAWATILNTGVMNPSLIAVTPPNANDPFADAGKGATGSGASHEARTAVGNPGDKLDWGVGNGGAGSPAPAHAGGSSGRSTGATGATSGTTVAAPPTSATLTPGTGDLKEHKMAQGETFSSIAVSLYGDVKYAREIVKANPTLEPSRIRAGTVIKLPDMATIRASQNAPAAAGHAVTAGASATKTEPAIDPSKEYKVQANDSLHKIALKLYGKPDKADAIYDANKEKIGGDPHRIKVGMVLKLPEPPTHSPTATR